LQWIGALRRLASEAVDEVFSYSLKRLVPPSEATFQDFKLTVVSDARDDWLGVYEVTDSLDRTGHRNAQSAGAHGFRN
jgi:hypothetical protein